MKNMNRMNMSNQCPCSTACKDIFLDNVPLGMGYIPWQRWDSVYDLNRSLSAGTIFPCLDKPFLGRAIWK